MRHVELSRTLTIDGRQRPCTIYVDVAAFDGPDEGRGAEVDITKVTLDDESNQHLDEVPQDKWPPTLLEDVSDEACDVAREHDADDFELDR